MAARIARLPVDRTARYQAWAAGFESLREEFRAICIGFSESYRDTLYDASISRYDFLTFEKYDALLKKAPASKTWHLALNIYSDRTSERIVFFFRHISPTFAATLRKDAKNKGFPPTEVTLGISRNVAGTYQLLREEPIRIREIAYNDGRWYWLIRGEQRSFGVERFSLGDGLNQFLQDAVATFL
jgi:hypothetical protein